MIQFMKIKFPKIKEMKKLEILIWTLIILFLFFVVASYFLGFLDELVEASKNISIAVFTLVLVGLLVLVAYGLLGFRLKK